MKANLLSFHTKNTVTMKEIIILTLCFLSLLLMVGCESEAEKSRKLAEEQARAERTMFDRRKAEVLAEPSRFLETSDLIYYDEGFIKNYRQLVSVKITNRSAVNIRLKKVRIVWLLDNNDEIGTTQLTFTGVISPAAEMIFSLKDGNLKSTTIQGAATKARIEFTDIEVIAPSQR
ncbi:MAG: hypothetical protein AABZ11_09795 [Nitrospinota bacterium]